VDDASEQAKESLMKSIVRTLIVLSFVVVTALGAWGCTDEEGNELTLDEYFARLEEIDVEFNERSETLFNGVSPGDPEAVREAFEQFPDLVGDFVAELEDLDPPDEARDVHDRAIDAGNDMRTEFESILDEIGDASAEELFTAADGGAFSEASDRFSATCVELLGIAEENNVDVTLNCGEDEGATE
jgi:hypothetical protein